MIEKFAIPEPCIINRIIPVDKIPSEKREVMETVKEINWYATISPKQTGIIAVSSGATIYEEVQFFQVELESTQFIFEIVREICKTIPYPCVFVFKYRDRYTLSSCLFRTSQKDGGKNKVIEPTFSHWLHEDCLSPGAEKLIAQINNALSSSKDLKTLHSQITFAIQCYPLSGISRAKSHRLIGFLVNKPSKRQCEELLQPCCVYVKYFPTNGTLSARYDKTARTHNYEYRYDTEEIWYCLMQNEATRNAIERRRFRDMEDLLFTAAEKGW